MADPNIVHKGVVVAAERLIRALSEEAQINRRYRRRSPKNKLLKDWKAARKRVDHAARAYADALEYYCKRVQTTFRGSRSSKSKSLT